MFSDVKNDNLIVGLEVSDDAAVYRLDDEKAAILTIDFFTPVVDDPYYYGAIAAANAMSDVYAMGGEVAVALNICAFPGDMDESIITEIMRGGADKVKEAGGVLAGGHTVDDKEPKYGLSVTGFVHPDSVMTKAGARPGDKIILTKPLGTGIITTAGKKQKAEPSHIDGAVASMVQLSRTASRILVEEKIKGCTDITGFGLLGHASEIAEKSGAGMHISASALPFLCGSRDYAEAGLFPGGMKKNRNAFGHNIRFSEVVDEETRRLMFTPETSGGLLAAIPPSQLDNVLARFEERGCFCRVIGEVTDGRGIEVSG
mgnify:CR=1 FL=1